VKGEKSYNGTSWEVPRDQILLLDCKGGDGGNGGRAEDGQHGGQGARGRDATKYRDAEVSVPSSYADIGRPGN
jgi:hypothetical protein